MKHYHKIDSIFNRDPKNKNKTFTDEYARPEFEYLKDALWVFTEKVNGTSIVIEFDPENGVTFGGKTDNAQIPATLVSSLQSLFLNSDIFDLFHRTFDQVVTFYGEGYGARIQKGSGNYRSDVGFVLFDVFCGGLWLKRESCCDISDKFEIDIVPIIGEGTLREACGRAREGFKSVWGDFQAEGIVARPKVDLYNRMGKRIITKVKCKDFPKESRNERL